MNPPYGTTCEEASGRPVQLSLTGRVRFGFDRWRARRMLRWLVARNLVIHVPEDEPRLAHYWTHLRTHPWLVRHEDADVR